MEFTEFDEGGDERVMFVLGWGNRTDHENVRWLVDELVEAGYVVDVGQIPVHISDFEREYLAPTQERYDATDPDRILSHSTGGLITAHLDADVPRVYLSPWWGLATEGSIVQRLLVALPTSRPVIPVPDDPGALGDLATERQLADGANYAAPAFLRTIIDAQERLPPLREDAVVFCSLQDRVVGVDAIGARAPAARTVLYDGGHEFFSSSGRERTVEQVIATLDGGPKAVPTPPA
jgi:hypothetical protein